MRLRAAFVLAALCLIPGFRSPARIEIQARHGKSLRGSIDGVTLLLLRGSHRERGVDHGFLAAREIVRVLDEALVPGVSRLRAGGWEKDFVSQVDRFTWPPRFEEELTGMLEGLRRALPDKEDRTLRSIGREISLADLKALNALSDILGVGCSSFSAWGNLTADGQVITGRNLDYAAFPVSFAQCLLAVMPEEKDLKPTLDFSMTGALGTGTTMNEDGVLISLHDEKGLPDSRSKEWIPRFLTIRTAIEGARKESSVADVAEVFRRAGVKTGNILHLSVPRTKDAAPAMVEWDGNAKEGGVSVRLAEGKDWIATTNHYFVRASRGGGESGQRYGTISHALEASRAAGAKIGLREARAILESVSKSGSNVTHLSVVAWPAERRMAFALTPGGGKSAAGGRWIEFGWEEVFRN